MIRTFIYKSGIGNLKLTFYMDGVNSYCLYDGESMETNYHQWTYELWISQNSDILTEVTELCKMEIKKHNMTK